MREILFRAKRKDNNEWVEGYYIYHIKRTLCVAGDSIKPEDEQHVIMCDGFSDWNMPRGTVYFNIDPETICQFTGMLDKKGNRIWENDIVSAWSEGKYAKGRVKQRIDGLYIIYPAYQHDEFWGLCPDKNRKTNVEIIGNIFDNPELLGGAE